jgi:hypothetical protein
VTNGAATPDPPARPYMRHQALDQGWLTPSIDGQVDSFSPASGPSLYHWESRDIKVDARRPGTGGGSPYHQNDPENPLPLSHVAFDQLIDNSQNLPQSDQANVHVQVHNRSYTSLSNVAVWPIWCRPAGVVPSLAASPSNGNTYDFWGQFHADGTIHPGLPLDSPWKEVGPPTTISNIDAAHPQIDTFAGWTVPTLLPGDPGHYCVVAFVHSQLNPINESNTSVDAIATSNPQVAQKNLHVTTMVPLGARARGGFGIREYVEFHNPIAEESLVSLVFDLSELPQQLQGLVQLTHLDTDTAAGRSVTGGTLRHVKVAGKTTLAKSPLALRWLLQWSDRFEDAAEREDHDRDDFLFIPRFAPHIYAIDPASTFEVGRVRLKPFGTAAAIFAITTGDRSVLTRDYRFRVFQRRGEKVIGGSTYWIRATAPVNERKPTAAKAPEFVEPPFPMPERF